MNYTYMKVFYTVCKHQNISKAALELDLTQPALSRIISNLEQEYSTRLFYRSKSGVTLSKEGLKLYEMIKRPYAELERMEKDISSAVSLINQTVHIGTTTTALYVYLSKFLDAVKQKYPSANFRFYTGSSKELLDKVDQNEIDFAFITTPFKHKGNIKITNSMELNDVLIAPISYKDKLKDVTSLKELINYPFIFLNKDMQFREHIDQYLLNNGVPIIPAYEIDNSSLIINLVDNNYGLSFIPYKMAEPSLNEGKCFIVNIKEKIPPRYIAFAIKEDSNYSNIIYEIRNSIEEFIK